MPASPEDLSKLIGSAYSAAADPALWDQFLRQLAHTTGAQSAGLVMLDVSQDMFMISSSFNFAPEATRLYQQHYGPMDLWHNADCRSPPGTYVDRKLFVRSAKSSRPRFTTISW